MEQLVIGPARRSPSVNHVLSKYSNYGYTQGRVVHEVRKTPKGTQLGPHGGMRKSRVATLSLWWNPELRADSPSHPSRIWSGFGKLLRQAVRGSE